MRSSLESIDFKKRDENEKSFRGKGWRGWVFSAFL